MYALGDFGSFHAGGRIVTVSGKEKRIVRFPADMAHEEGPDIVALHVEVAITLSPAGNRS